MQRESRERSGRLSLVLLCKYLARRNSRSISKTAKRRRYALTSSSIIVKLPPFLPPKEAMLIIAFGVNGGDDVPASLEHPQAVASEAAADARDVTQEEEVLPLENEVIADLLQSDGVEEDMGGLDNDMHKYDHEAAVDNAEDLMVSQEMLSQERIPDVVPPEFVAAEEVVFSAHTDYVHASDDEKGTNVRHMPSLHHGEIFPAAASTLPPPQLPPLVCLNECCQADISLLYKKRRMACICAVSVTISAWSMLVTR
jgi:hypothetical protein